LKILVGAKSRGFLEAVSIRVALCNLKRRKGVEYSQNIPHKFPRIFPEIPINSPEYSQNIPRK